MRSALVRNELCVHYMPIVDVMTGKVRAVEALARWQHPRLGLVPPSKFLGLAQEAGLIVSIDQWVLQTASRQLQDWRRDIATANRLSISVNFSRDILEQADVGAHIDRVLRESHLVPADLNMDINESVLAPDNGIDNLADLHQRGLKLHMDDFGVGQGWLRHLHKIEVDTIKMDRSFLAGGGDRDRQVLGRIVQIARDLGKTVIAEGAGAPGARGGLLAGPGLLLQPAARSGEDAHAAPGRRARRGVRPKCASRSWPSICTGRSST